LVTTQQITISDATNHEGRANQGQPFIIIVEKRVILKHECKIQVMIDHMRDLEFRLQKKRNRHNGQVNAINEALIFKVKLNVEEEVEDFVDLNNIEAYTIQLQSNKKLRTINEQNTLNLTIINVLAVCLVELNLVESPLPLPSLWYLDSRAIHHVSEKTIIFSTMQHMNNNNLRLTNGQEHGVVSIGNVNIQCFDGVVKNIPHVLHSPAIQNNFLSIGFIVDQNHSIEFFSKGCFV
jgi:hypothetical protein